MFGYINLIANILIIYSIMWYILASTKTVFGNWIVAVTMVGAVLAIRNYDGGDPPRRR